MHVESFLQGLEVQWFIVALQVLPWKPLKQLH